ncbi:mandelate racemase/muconate lactonizing enzyme family protein [Falsiroseomonas stagni]|uniref:glucarate dehydratase n=1 Tax=Falsiroseomonas stagni DSM 19981 TaxID=1123062 RepID=A0A1I4E9I9_9PROT|nr:mandelate racemase/muconate lactonizing enzyme family protein [Falsiroseomonas stagni]SFL01943.1 glucarate dehydratase [Falsiroseomonas stagni DSM 19981]
MNAAPLLGLDEATWLGGIAATPRAIGAAALTQDPFAACLARGTTLVVADAESAGGLAGLRDLAALARALGVTLAVKPGAGGVERATALAGALDAAVAAEGPLPALPPQPRDSPTRIVSVTVQRIALPLKHLYVSSMYCTPKQDRTLVAIRLADGTVGWGETNGTPDCAARVVAIAKGWIGRDALRDRASLRRAFARISFDNRHGRNGLAAYAGLDLAAWDASAKHLSVPLAALLGQSAPLRPVEVACPLPAAVPGRAMDRAEITAHMADLSLAPRVAELAAGIAAAHGIRAFKYKSAATGIEWDIAALTALRATLPPGTRLRCDPNGAYSPEEARRLVAGTAALELEFHEDPTDALEGFCRLREAGAGRLASNMCLIEPPDLVAAHRLGLTDLVVLGDIFYWGGIAGLRDASAVAARLGLTPSLHSFYETAVATAANWQMAQALGLDADHPMDCGVTSLAEDIVAPGMLTVRDGVLTGPEGPGIGLAPDPARIAALAIADPVVIPAP